MSPHLHFADFRWDGARLWSGATPVRLRPKAGAVLAVLLARPGEVVGKRELIDAVWPNGYVGDAALAVCVNELRRALGDDPRTPRIVATVHRRGYQLIVSVRTADSVVRALTGGLGALVADWERGWRRPTAHWDVVVELCRRVVAVADAEPGLREVVEIP